MTVKDTGGGTRGPSLLLTNGIVIYSMVFSPGHGVSVCRCHGRCIDLKSSINNLLVYGRSLPMLFRLC